MDYLYFDVRYRLIICKPCQTAIAVDDKYRIQSLHFLTKHSISKPERKLLQSAITNFEPSPFAEVKQKLNSEGPIDKIQYLPVEDGYACQTCPNWLSLNQRAASEHVRAMHSQESGTSLNGLWLCKLQKLN